MKLLYTKRSPYARKARIVALEKNIPLELVDENLTQKSKLLLDTNALGKIPTLILDNGETIMDSPVICQYLDSLNDKPILIPRDGHERFHTLRWEAIADGLADVAIVVYMEKIRHPNDFNAPFVAAQEETIGRTLAFMDKNFRELNDLSLAPIAAVSGVGYAQFRLSYLIDGNKYPNLMAWFAEFSKRPSVQSTVPVA